MHFRIDSVYCVIFFSKCLNIAVFSGQDRTVTQLHALPSIRQHLSYDDCLEGEREGYQNSFCAVLCNAIVHIRMCTEMSSSYR